MLPFRHTNKNVENMEPQSGSVIKNSRRSKYLDLPYNGSSTSFYNNSSPSFPAYPRCSTPSMQFRQRPRPLHLQMNQPTSISLQVTPDDRDFGRHRSVHAPIRTKPLKLGGSSTTLMQAPRSPPPASPGLDQVLTEMRPGPNVVWFCERKRPKSKLWSNRNVLVCILLLMTIGFGVYRMFDFAQDAREGYQIEVEDTSFQDYSEGNSYAFQEEHIEEVGKPNLIISDGNNSTDIGSSQPPARIRILYSINEDLESTVEVIEG